MKKSNLLFKIFLVIYIMCFLVGLTKEYSTSYVRYIKYILMLLFVIFYLAKNKLVITNKKILSIVGIIVLANTVIPIGELLIRPSDNIQVILYSGLCFIFICFCMTFASVLQDDIINRSTVKILLVMVFIFILYMFIKYNTSYSIMDIFKVLNNYERVRSSFGFSHVNTLGNITVSYLVLDFYNLVILKNNNKVLNIFRIFIIYVLVRSASRTSILGISLFILIYFISIKFTKIKIERYLKTSLIILLVILMIYKVFNIVVTPEFLAETNRYNHLVNNIQLIINSNNWLIGLGNVNPLNIYDFAIGLRVNDNWFIYLFVVQGLVGIILILLIILCKIKYFIFDIKDYKLKSFYIALIILNITLSIFEMYYFVPGSLSSMVYWILIIDILVKCNKVNIKNGGNYAKKHCHINKYTSPI